MMKSFKRQAGVTRVPAVHKPGARWHVSSSCLPDPSLAAPSQPLAPEILRSSTRYGGYALLCIDELRAADAAKVCVCSLQALGTFGE